MALPCGGKWTIRPNVESGGLASAPLVTLVIIFGVVRSEGMQDGSRCFSSGPAHFTGQADSKQFILTSSLLHPELIATFILNSSPPSIITIVVR